MNCYFCQSPLKKSGMTHPKPNGAVWEFYESCDYCTSTHGVSKVFTTFDEKDKSVLFAHIYVDLTPFTTNWHIRLHLKENFTNVGDPEGYESPLHLPGFPINPANAKDKVKLYLLFS